MRWFCFTTPPIITSWMWSLGIILHRKKVKEQDDAFHRHIRQTDREMNLSLYKAWNKLIFTSSIQCWLPSSCKLWHEINQAAEMKSKEIKRKNNDPTFIFTSIVEKTRWFLKKLSDFPMAWTAFNNSTKNRASHQKQWSVRIWASWTAHGVKINEFIYRRPSPSNNVSTCSSRFCYCLTISFIISCINSKCTLTWYGPIVW